MKPKNIAYLKGLANKITPSINIGKGDLTDSLLQSVDNALEAHELIKVRLLNNSDCPRKEMGEILAKATNSTHVSTIGRNITLFRSSKKRKIILPIAE